MEATYQALSHVDVVTMICCQCDKPTLASLARTRRDISEIALDVLWYSIPDIGFLIRCMPKDLWAEEKDEENPSNSELVTMLLLHLRVLPFNKQADISKVHLSN